MTDLAQLGDDEALRAHIKAALAARTRAQSPRSFPICAPLPGQAHLFEQCVRHAERRGLRLPARLTVEWHDSPPSIEHGTTHGAYDPVTKELIGDLVVVVSANLMPGRLREVVYHELFHVSLALDPALRQLDPVEEEVRAIHFERHMTMDLPR